MVVELAREKTRMDRSRKLAKVQEHIKRHEEVRSLVRPLACFVLVVVCGAQLMTARVVVCDAQLMTARVVVCKCVMGVWWGAKD
jgi:hypothetical protein